MLDFFTIRRVEKRKGSYVIRPEFFVGRSEDLMIRGGEFYAIWDEEFDIWSTDPFRAMEIIDRAVSNYWDTHPEFHGDTTCAYIRDSSTKMANEWKHYIEQQMPSNMYHELDREIIFQNSPTTKRSYASRRLPYAIQEGDHSAWDELVDVLYLPGERLKLEWAIGSIISGDSKRNQKFAVLYGAPGSGKSTILNIIQGMFPGYWAPFESRALGSKSDAFAMEPFKENPLIAIEHDGNLADIEDNTRINSIVSHEPMVMNTKHKSLYTIKLQTFMFVGTNTEVRITSANSGIIRRLLDIYPSNALVPLNRYLELMNRITFEYGAIAQHCLDIYLANQHYYDAYVAESMIGESNIFYNFVQEHYDTFLSQDSTTLSQAWKMYQSYVEEAGLTYKYNKIRFKNELKLYFDRFYEKKFFPDGSTKRNFYQGFLKNKFHWSGDDPIDIPVDEISLGWLQLKDQESTLDILLKDAPAQEANAKGYPKKKWIESTTSLCDINTRELHYVKLTPPHIVIDFDGDTLEENLEAASAFPPTYAELSKSGSRIHLHYIYDGDASKLASSYGYKIEIKVYNGNSALRRLLTKCNNLEVAHISSGLPLKGDKAVLDTEVLANERHLRALIAKGLNKDVWPNTRPSMDYIKMILEKAYNQPDFIYDVTDMRQAILTFATMSTNQSEYCYSVAANLPYKSKDVAMDIPWKTGDDSPLVFFDVEVFPNLFVICWKYEGKENQVVRMINPSPLDVDNLTNMKLVGFNNKRYDNLILYARLQGATEYELYKLSSSLINSGKNRSHFEQEYMINANAKNLSYCDIWDFANGDHRKGLKKWEISLHIHHKECPYDWNQPVPEDKWVEIADYCANDVLATEATFEAMRDNDFKSREILAKVADMPLNSSTNELTARIIFGNNRKPQSQFNYRDLSEPVVWLPDEFKEFISTHTTMPLKFMPWDGSGNSLLPYFPGYEFDNGKSYYRGELVGEGGFVYAEPGIHYNVALLDVASMHPTSAVDEILFGYEYTQRFYDLLQTRLHVKHKEFDEAALLFEGKMAEFLQDPSEAKKLAQALKIPINMVYGNTSAKFENKFRDPRNVDNIVAKRGALFMIDLKNAVESRGFTVAHIKTDSIKIPDATPEIIDFVMKFGEYYGYTFEHEATYEKMALVNDAVYIAKYASKGWCEEAYGYVPEKCYKDVGSWTSTGTQFSVPFVFKTLFSHEPIEFYDTCETKSVSDGAAIHLDMNEGFPDVSFQEKLYKKKFKESGGVMTPELEELKREIDIGHNYRFVGAVGLFCPVVEGSGGGIMMRVKGDTKGAVGGTKGYRWLEAEDVLADGKENMIDISYYEAMVDAAKAAIEEYGSFEEFAS